MSRGVMRCTTLASPRDDPMFTTIKDGSRHEDTQLYGAILLDELTNEAIKDSESYKEYYAIASGASVKKKQTKSDKTKTPPTAKGKRLKNSAKAAKPAKKNQPAKTSKAKGLTVLFEVALTEAEQMELATKRSLIQTHNSHASSSGTDEGTSDIAGVPDVPTYTSDDEQISWKSSDEEDDDEVAMSDDDDDDDDDDANNQDDDDNDDDEQIDDNTDNENDGNDDDDDDDDDDDGQDHEGPDVDNEQTDSDNDGDDFVHPKFSTNDKEDNEEEGSNLRVQTPSYYESTDDDESNEVTHGANVEGDGRDTEMTDALRTIIQTTQVIEDTYVIITPINPEGQQQSSSVSSGFVSKMFNPSPYTGIDSIFNLNTESTSLVDVLVTTIAKLPLSSTKTLPPPNIPLITHLQQTPAPTPTTVLSSSLQDLPNFGSLFKFDSRLKTLETDFSKFKQTNQFATEVSSIPSIVDAYLANKMHEAVKTAIQLQSDLLRDEAQAENEDFINKLDDNIKKIIKDQVKKQVKAQVSKILPKIKKTVNEQLEVEVLTHSSNESKTSYDVAANLSELELKKILIDKMESNKSINRYDEQKNLYKALVDAYQSDKLILDTYGDTVSFKRRRDDEDKDEEPSAGSNRGSKRRRAGKESESTNKPDEETSQYPDWFQKPAKLPTLDRDWNKTLPTAHGPVQPWLSTLAQNEDTRESFNELMETPLDFSTFVMNRLKFDTLTPELLASPTFELMEGSCKSLKNPEGQQYPHDLRKPLPLIPNSRGRQVIPFDHFINNDLAYLSGGVSSQTYTTSMTKTKAADYRHIKWIEDLVPNRIESARDVYSKRRIIAITKLQIIEWHNYKHLDWITVRRDDDKMYTFIEGDFNRLHIQDIKDMLLLLVQGKLANLTIEERLAFNVSLRISDLKRMEAYTAYSNPIGFIYHNKDKKNRLIRINELYKFCDGTLNDVRTALNDRLKGIQIKYLA
ncbi:hypothetical protein Tco_0194855 [Tanacetum coccineum]